MKSTFQVVQQHAQKIQELLNAHGIDLESQMYPIEFAKAVDASTEEILKMRNLLKKRVQAGIVPPKEKDAKGKKKSLLENGIPGMIDLKSEKKNKLKKVQKIKKFHQNGTGQKKQLFKKFKPKKLH